MNLKIELTSRARGQRRSAAELIDRQTSALAPRGGDARRVVTELADLPDRGLVGGDEVVAVVRIGVLSFCPSLFFFLTTSVSIFFPL